MDKDKIKAFLDRIAAIESSSGKDTNHPQIESGIHEGDRAIGRFALMPNTIDELVNRAASAGVKSPEMKKLRSLASDEKRDYLENNPELEYKLAEQLATHVLNKQGGDEDKAAYSWLYGHNLSPKKIEAKRYSEDPYVQKFKKLKVPMEDENKKNPNQTEINKKALQKVSQDASKQMQEMIQGRFKNSERVPENPGEVMDAYLGVPVRTGISELQQGNFNMDALKRVLGSVGNDPQTAPTGVDLASATGIQNPYIGAALATAVDLGAQVPMGAMGKAGALPGGMMGTVEKVSPGLEKFLSTRKALQREGGYASRLAKDPAAKVLESSQARQVLGDKSHKLSQSAVDKRLNNPLAEVTETLEAQAPQMKETRALINKLVDERGLYDPEVQYLQKQYNELLGKKKPEFTE